MTKTKRFIVNENREIIDTLNLTKRPKGYCYEGDPEDDVYLRERVLWARLGDLVGDLIIDPPGNECDFLGGKYTPINPVRESILWMLRTTIRASRLNGHNVDVSNKTGFNRTLERKKDCFADQTSISLFIDDVGHLLRDLYGDIELETFDDILLAIHAIVVGFTEYSCAELCKEYKDARNYDFGKGIGFPDGYIVSYREQLLGLKSLSDLLKKTRTVLQNRSDFSRYTVKFATYCADHFCLPGESGDVGDDVSDIFSPVF